MSPAKRVVNLLYFSLLVSLLVGPVIGAEGDLLYGRVLEKELAGETAGALAEYRLLLPEVPATESALKEKILYRIGLCEQRLGHPEEARQNWRKLVESYPPNDSQVVRAREALRRLEQELDRIVIEGGVRVQGSGFRGQGSGGSSLDNTTTQPVDDAQGRQLNNCFILAGEWGNEPPVLTGSNGMFRVERKVAGQLGDGRRYSYLFAEHPTKPLVGAGVASFAKATEARGGKVQGSGVRGQGSGVRGQGSGVRVQGAGVLSPNSLITLQPAIDLAGRVVDARGGPVDGALIRVVGYGEVFSGEWQGEEKKGETEEVIFPFDNILPPVFSGTNGEFVVKGLARGVRYVLTADKPQYRLVSAGGQKSGVRSPESGVTGSDAPVSVGSIVLQSLGEVSLRGRVVDDEGRAVSAMVAVWTLSPVEREIGRVATELDGRFEIRDIRENLVALKVESEGCLPRSLSGLKPMGQEVDVVVKRVQEKGREGSGGRVQEKGREGSGVRVQEKGREGSGVRVQEGILTRIERNANTTRFNSLNPEPRTLITSFDPLPPEPRTLITSSNSLTPEPRTLIPSLQRWARGDLENGGALSQEALKGHVVVYHFGSAYVESSLRSLYPREPGGLTQLLRLYGEQGLVVIWVLPEDEGRGEAVRMALELYPDLPVAVGGPTPARGNLVVGRDGATRPPCSDQALFKSVKQALGY